jgi:CTP synthase (UTP-ammonia lyase)
MVTASLLYDILQVICLHDARSIYEVPLMLEEQKLSALLISRLNLGLPLVRPRGFMKKWKQLVSR